jgi:hypothetical protein
MYGGQINVNQQIQMGAVVNPMMGGGYGMGMGVMPVVNTGN